VGARPENAKGSNSAIYSGLCLKDLQCRREVHPKTCQPIVGTASGQLVKGHVLINGVVRMGRIWCPLRAWKRTSPEVRVGGMPTFTNPEPNGKLAPMD
jgi:hypothetical protein